MESLFYQSIQATLKSWTALQLAVSKGFGGPHSVEKAQWLIGVIQNFFEENDGIEPYELEDFIEEIMSTEFSIIAEDNSIKDISVEICNLHTLCAQGKSEEVKERLRKLPCVNLGDCMASAVHDEQTQNSTQGDDEVIGKLSISPSAEQQGDQPRGPDADGWVEVKSRKKRK